MITIIYSTHKDSEYNSKFKNHLLESIGVKSDKIQILEYQNNNQYSLSEVYNKGILESKYDIIVCCHNDIKLESNWGKKLLKDFELNPDYAIIGKAGSCYFPESGIYWEKMNQTMVGQVWHHPENQKKWLNKYSVKLPFLIPVVTIDGLFISFDKRKIKHKFDESFGRFHFYDHSFCLPNYLEGVKIGVTTSFEITHQSVGQPNEEFFETKEKFLEKFKNNLPLDLKPQNVYIPHTKNKNLKLKSKVAIIILTKGKVELLTKCINSFFEFCDKNIFDIIVADTGSSENEFLEIKKLCSKDNIKLIQYDYYHFARINNDIVSNHLNDTHEYILFCNNDIQILNDVIHEMILSLKTSGNIGSVGARLHYPDNTIQHDGLFGLLNQKFKTIEIGHQNPSSYYNFKTNPTEVIGNTAALLMMKKAVFKSLGMFNESYRHCFEDVQLTLSCIVKGYKNIMNGKCVAIHHESQTRDIKLTESETLEDYNFILLPFVKQNFEKLKKYFYIV